VLSFKIKKPPKNREAFLFIFFHIIADRISRQSLSRINL